MQCPKYTTLPIPILCRVGGRREKQDGFTSCGLPRELHTRHSRRERRFTALTSELRETSVLGSRAVNCHTLRDIMSSVRDMPASRVMPLPAFLFNVISFDVSIRSAHIQQYEIDRGTNKSGLYTNLPSRPSLGPASALGRICYANGVFAPALCRGLLPKRPRV
jgi:hypothetical protein